TILLNGSSTTTAPVVSKRPRRTTLVMPPARSSTEISMQHLLFRHLRPRSSHSGIRFPAECRNHSPSGYFRTIQSAGTRTDGAARLWTAHARLEPGNSMLKGGKRARVHVPN